MAFWGEGWTDERVEALKVLWAEGHSASVIAKKLGGVTRSGVIGKVHRLGISNRGDRNQQSRAGQAKKSALPPKWPAEKDEQFRIMWAADVPASEIAKTMGIGTEQNAHYRAKRLGLPKRHRKKGLKTSNAAPRSGDAGPFEPTPVQETEVAQSMTFPMVKGLPAALLERDQRQCNWPVGDVSDPAFFYCTNRHEPGRRYCAGHARASVSNYTPGAWDKSREAWARANPHLHVAKRLLERLDEAARR